MTEDEAKKLKKQILHEISGGASNPKYASSLQSNELSSRIPKESRLSIGYSITSSGSYQLELRVQKGGGKAFEVAKQIKREIGEVNIAIVPQMLIPSKNEFIKSVKFDPFCKAVRPLHIGLSIGHINGGSGTLGGFVENEEGRQCILSCNHVMALYGQIDDDDPNRIYQPGKTDKQGMVYTDAIGRLSDYVPLSDSDPNQSDSAIAILNKGIEHLSNIIPTNYGFLHEGETIRTLPDPSESRIPLSKGMKVYKIGKSTGQTFGYLSALSVDNVVINAAFQRNKPYVFDNVIEVDWQTTAEMSAPGDSGSLAYIEYENKLYAIGLLFASGIKMREKKESKVSFFCSLKDILQVHGVSWVNG